MNPLMSIPGLGGYLGAQQIDQGNQIAQMRQMNSLVQLQQLFKQQEAQEQALQKERQFRGEIAKAKTPEEQLSVASRFMGPDALGRMVQGGLDRQAQREVAQTNAAAQREQRMFEIQQRGEQAIEQIRLRAEEGRISRQEADARERQTREFMARLTASLRPDRSSDNKAPAGFRFTADGNLERIPGGPADIKAEEELKKKASGAGDVDVSLATLRDAYDRLEKGGGITSTENTGIGNVLPSVSSSAVGQAAGKLFGTNNQSARNDITMARPALLAALMKATGMSAKQMDSNAELKLWITTATDPTLDVQANRRALDNIERKYLGGSKPSAGATGKFDSPKPGAVVDGYRFKGGDPANRNNWVKQ